ncbi:MAG: hypothetical protein KY451_11030 [Actinobacteria bacterium]|nr:hypothetical protein [Actinomycetota bacterium]
MSAPRRLASILLLSAGLLLAAHPAAADAEQVVANLREQRLFIAPESAVRPDAGAVLAALDAAAVPTYVAVVPQADVDAEELGVDGLLLQIVEQLAEPGAVVLLVTDGQELQARDGGRSGADPSAVLERVLASRLDQPFTPANLTAAVVDFVEQVDQQAQTAPAGRDTTLRTVGLTGLVVVAALGGGGWLYGRAQRRLPDPSWPGASGREEGTMGS